MSSTRIPEGTARSLHRDLVAWYRREQRALPWRRSRDPYRVLVSEAMLQQTRVETAIGYYERFLRRFPDVGSLARARPQSVLAAWSGLGYYRRARSLHGAAREVVSRLGGRFPRDRAGLLALPGVGEYTAGAVASIAFDAPEPLVDGNVARVLSRLFGLDDEPGSAAGRRELWSIASRLVPPRGAGEWNQSLMELGALVCAPREPACGRCPIARRCVARREGRTADLPRRAPGPRPTRVDVEVLAVRDRGRWLLERRPERGRMAGLWQLPTFQSSDASEASSDGRLFPPLRSGLLRAGAALCEVRHTITHHRIRAVVRRARLGGRGLAAPFAWVPESRVQGLALTGMTRKCLLAILAAEPRTRGGAPQRSQRSTRNRHNA